MQSKISLPELLYFIVFVVALSSSSGRAQNTSLDHTLDQLAASASDFSKYIPSFTCREHIHSERKSTPAGFGPRILPATMEVVGNIQEMRVDGRLQETRVWRTVDGHLVSAGQKVVPPYILNEAFGLPIPAYLDSRHRACLRFVARRGRLDFTGTPLAGRGACADIAPQVTGFLTFDPSTGSIEHLERTVPVAAGAQGGFAPFASIDYISFTPPDGDGRSYQLPSRIIATRHNNGYTLVFDAKYDECKLYKAHSTIIYGGSQLSTQPDSQP
jgi:hypothetical protein